MKAARNSNRDKNKLTLDDFKHVWGKALQRPLVDPKKETLRPKRPKVVAKKTIPATNVRFDGELIGTLIDRDPTMTRAWLQISNRKRMVVTGQSLDDLPGKPVVKSIKHGQVDVAIGERIFSLTKQKSVWSEPESSPNPKAAASDLNET